MKVLVIDCYDSFTFNLVQQIGAAGAEPVVVTNDTPFRDVKTMDCERIVLSPGPGRPEEAGVCLDVLHTMSRTIPTLGVCLGHQAICIAFGGKVIGAPRLVHGKVSHIRHDGTGILKGVSNPLTATRYHSLVADPLTLPDELRITATSLDDGTVMGLQHRTFPITGLQFHPESILTPEGGRILGNFLSTEETP